MLKITRFISLLVSFVIISSIPSYASERDQWQQFRAQQGMKELEAEFAQPKAEPEVRVEIREVEKIVIREVPVPAPAPLAVAPMPVAEPAAATPASDATVTVEADGFVFQLGGCRLASSNIKCDLSILSTEKDGTLILYSTYDYYKLSSKLFDRLGNEYHPSKITMGNKSDVKSIENQYITGVTAKGSMYFENVDKSTKSIALIELSIHNRADKKNNRIKFRNVNLTI